MLPHPPLNPLNPKTQTTPHPPYLNPKHTQLSYHCKQAIKTARKSLIFQQTHECSSTQQSPSSHLTSKVPLSPNYTELSPTQTQTQDWKEKKRKNSHKGYNVSPWNSIPPDEEEEEDFSDSLTPWPSNHVGSLFVLVLPGYSDSSHLCWMLNSDVASANAQTVASSEVTIHHQKVLWSSLIFGLPTTRSTSRLGPGGRDSEI